MASDDEDGLNLFHEPADFYKPEPEAKFASHKLLNGQELSLRLVGHNPLWGHFLWNAGRIIALYIEEHAKEIISDRTILELGAGGGLPSLVCALNGAKQVVVTDYPDADLIENLQYNIEHCIPTSIQDHVASEGHLWGSDVTKLQSYLPNDAPDKRFDALILADLLFNHSEHAKLVSSVQKTLKRSPSGTAFVFFTPYRPWLLQKDLAFFDLAKEAGFKVDKILEKVMDKVMFDEDPGDELLRRTVYGYALTWAESE